MRPTPALGIAVGGSLLLLAGGAAALPQPTPAGLSPSRLTAPARPAPLDAARIAAWTDSVVPAALAASGMPGAIVVVAQRAGVVVAKGYGVADLAAGTPVDPAVTLFNIASIGKSMTAAITAQLVDEGRLDLDRDVNDYLTSTKVTGPKVTLRMLLGHRGGFDDDITALFVPFDGDPTGRPGEWDRRLHPLIAPGYLTAYDNQGFGLIGLVLRDVTRTPLPALFQQRLFGPAAMTGAVLGRPPDGRRRLARCYTVQGPGRAQECEYWLYKDGLMGAGGVAASAADMGRYLRLLLNGGTLDGVTVISARAFADLTNFDHYRFHPALPGGGFAFIQFEEFRGLEYAHSGSIPGFSSMMKIYPDADVAIFASFLGGQPGAFDLTATGIVRALRAISVVPSAKPGLFVLRTLTDSIAARFVPAGLPRSSEGRGPAPAANLPVERFLGRYVIGSNHSRSYFSRFAGWGGLITLERIGGDSLTLAGIPDFGPLHPVGPLVYQTPTGERIALADSPLGPLMALGLSGAVFRKTDLIESPVWSLPVFAVALLLLLFAVIHLRPAAPPRLKRLSRGVVLGTVLVIGGLVAELEWGIRLGVVEGAVVVPALWRVALHLGAALLVWRAIGFLREGRSPLGLAGFLHGALTALAAIAIAVVLVAWRVIGAFPPHLTW